MVWLCFLLLLKCKPGLGEADDWEIMTTDFSDYTTAFVALRPIGIECYMKAIPEPWTKVYSFALPWTLKFWALLSSLY